MKTALLAILSALGTCGLLVIVWALCYAAKEAYKCTYCNRYWDEMGVMSYKKPRCAKIVETVCFRCNCADVSENLGWANQDALGGTWNREAGALNRQSLPAQSTFPPAQKGTQEPSVNGLEDARGKF